jgi:hypothetical protein
LPIRAIAPLQSPTLYRRGGGPLASTVRYGCVGRQFWSGSNDRIVAAVRAV